MLSATVLIPAHNEETSIGELVRACLEQSYPIDEVIVVADACTDATAERAREAGARVLEVDYQDKATSQNAALWEIESDVIIGFDGDTCPEPGCIELMMEDLNERGYDATCSTILPMQPCGFFIRARRFSYALGRRWWRLCQAQVGRIQVLTGASYAFKTSVIKAVGGFPSGLISADMDATWAMHADGYKLGYAARAVALTVDPESFTVWRAQMRRWASGYAQNMAKYRRHLLHPRSLLVVGTALFDLVSLFWSWTFFAYLLTSGHGHLLFSVYAIYFAAHVVLKHRPRRHHRWPQGGCARLPALVPGQLLHPLAVHRGPVPRMGPRTPLRLLDGTARTSHRDHPDEPRPEDRPNQRWDSRRGRPRDWGCGQGECLTSRNRGTRARDCGRGYLRPLFPLYDATSHSCGLHVQCT